MTHPRSQSKKTPKVKTVAKKIVKRKAAPKRDPRHVNPATKLPHTR